jgi:hypothetical protein
MHEQGVISAELLAWGDPLRFMGNVGAHPSETPVAEQDGTDALDFLNAIVETRYHLRPKFEELRARRDGSTAS